MSTQQANLLENHHDLAQFACTGENDVFWVLDLTDPLAFRLAEAHETPENLVATRDKELSANRIPALTLATPIETLNAYRTMVMGNDPVPHPPAGMLYIVVCTEGRIITAAIPKMTA